MSDISKTIRALAELKLRKAEASKAHDEVERTYNKAIAKMEDEIRANLNQQGVKQLRTEAGLVTLINDRKYSVKDWEETYKYITENGRPDLLQKRLSAGVLKEILEDSEGQLPPGVGFFDVVKVQFTKPKS